MGEWRSQSTRIGEPRNDRERQAARAFFRQDTFGSDARNASIDSSQPFVYEPDVLIAAWKGSRPDVVAGFRVAADGTAFVWPPQDAARSFSYVSAVMSSLIERLDSTWHHTALAVIEQDQKVQQRLLEQSGFAPTGAIAVMRLLLNGSSSTIPSPQRDGEDHGLRWTRFDASRKTRFESLIDRCLGVAGAPTRHLQPSGRELLASYAARDDFCASNWWLIGRDGCDVAVVLVHEGNRAREIVFLGVIPEARRQGLGTLALDFIRKSALNDRCHSIDVTVEVNNSAAVTLYAKAGFLATATRLGFVRRRLV